MRIKSSFKNLIFAVVGQILGLSVSFIARIVFIEMLGAEYLGLNSLFENILTVLSFFELGIGPAITFSLYKPLAEKNIEKIKSLMVFFRKAYVTIGLIILFFGSLITPFLNLFIKDAPNIPHLKFIFFLFVTNSAISYFYSYKRTLIISDQKRYIATFYRYSFFILLNIFQMVVLLLTKNYYLFLICQITFTALENIFVSKRVDQLYKFLREKSKDKLDDKTFKDIKKNIRALIAHKFGEVVVNATDNLLISKFIGLVQVGLYSNYQFIINALNIITGQVFSSISASVGNLGATETYERKKFVFQVVFLVNFWIFSFLAICLVVLANPFIDLWLGEEYVLNSSVVSVIILNFYLKGMRRSVLTFKEALGIFWYDRYKPIMEALINLFASLYLVKSFGLSGIFFGTTISTLSTVFWIEPYVLYKYGFKSQVMPYFKKYFLFTLLTIIILLITLFLTIPFYGNSFIILLVKIMICLIVPNGIFFILFFKTKEFQYLLKALEQIFPMKRK